MEDLSDLISDFIGKIPLQMMILLYIIYILISSDIFYNRVLSRINGATTLTSITSYGVLVQGIFLVVAYMIFDIITNYMNKN